MFGRYLTVGLAVLVAAAWLFGGVAQDVVAGDPLTVVDVLLSEWLRTHATRSLTSVMVVVSAVGGAAAVIGLGTAFATVLAWKRRRYELLTLGFAVMGGYALNVALKVAFARARPVWGDGDVLGYGFPSGHTMMATLLFGCIGVFSMRRDLRSRLWGAVVWALIGALVSAIGFSRIYLGAHYFSDVVAAVAAGTAWLAISVTSVETLQRYRQRPVNRPSLEVPF